MQPNRPASMLAAALMVAAVPVAAKKPDAGEASFHALYKQLVEINTTDSPAGSSVTTSSSWDSYLPSSSGRTSPSSPRSEGSLHG